MSSARRTGRRVRAVAGLPAVGPVDADLDVPRPPQVQMTLVRPVRGAVVRLLPAVLVLACALVMAREGPTWFLAGIAAALVTWRPRLPVPAVVALATGMWVYAKDDLLAAPVPGAAGGDGLLVTVLLVLFLHLLVRVTSLAAHVSWHSVVEAPVLGRVARSGLGAQLVAQSLVLAVVWLRSDVGAAVAGQGWLRAVAVAAAVAVAVLVVPREWLARRPEQ